MDPQQRIVLEHGYEAFCIANDNASSTGLFLGIQALEFPEILAALPASSTVYASTGSAHAIACGRLSFFLDLHGPCSSFDTACSTGLVAMHAASSAIIMLECAAVLVASINLMLVPTTSAACAMAGMTSVLGHCHTFDTRADGYARSEACSACGLGQRKDVISDLQAILLCTVIRQDGRSASLTAPNGQAQQALRLAVRAKAGSSSSSEYAEFHGTGTNLGDPIEVGSFAAVANVHSEPDIVGSVKANTGHSEPAAGSVGLLKLGLHLQHSTSSANAQLRNLNKRVSKALDPIIPHFPVQFHKLPPALSTGNVSSFGYNGTIAQAALRQETGNAARAPVVYRRIGFFWYLQTCPTGVSEPVLMYTINWELPSSAHADQSPSWMLLLSKVAPGNISFSARSWHTAVVLCSQPQSGIPCLDGSLLIISLAQRLADYATIFPRILVLTCGLYAMRAPPSVAVNGIALGLTRVLRLEHSRIRTQTVDMCHDFASILASANFWHLAEPELLSRGSMLAVARLRSCTITSRWKNKQASAMS